MWTRLGLNPQEEWIEEKKGVRRINSVSGVFSEDILSPSLRFGRVTSQEDLEKAVKSLSFAHILESFSSLRAAFDVYRPPCPYSDFRVLVERHMATRVYNAYREGKWSADLPERRSALLRHGLNPWPLAVDIGFARRYGFSSLEATSRQSSEWVSLDKNQNHNHSVPLVFPRQTLYLPQDILPCSLSWEEWVGEDPAPLVPDAWSSDYHPFSSPVATTGYVDPLMNQALHASMKDVDEDALHKLAEEYGLKDALSPDQLDAVWMAYRQMKEGKPFLLADDTGYGKGRVLASLCKIAHHHDIQVLFVTEKKDLFSDFYRDCLAVFGTSVPSFVLAHTQGKVIHPDGDRVKVSRIKEFGHEPWIWTTYSQFNRADLSKIKNVLSWIARKTTWLIMDEAHNASGQSNTFEAFSKFTAKSAASLFSSATFAKQEHQLEVYRSMFSGTKDEWKRLKNSFSHSLGARTALTLNWSKEGKYLRRQHPPMAPPSPLWVKPDEKAQRAFVLWWQKMYLLASAWHKVHGGGAWKKIGSPLARAQREFSLLQKLSFLIEQVKLSVQRGEKPVVVSDWTLSSHVSRLVQNSPSYSPDQEIPETEEISLSPSQHVSFASCPLWKDSWMLLVDDIFPVQGCVTPSLKKAHRDVKDALTALPDWSTSPFDALSVALNQHGIQLGEISGRNWRLEKESSSWRVVSRDASSRIETIRSFNDGKIDAVLLTRAGNSGTSLHASKTFIDRRQRHLIEWDISPDPSVRLQFWGRVRRRDQVMEPQRTSLLEDSFYGRRLYFLDTFKQNKLLAHGGSWQEEEKLHLWSGILAREWARLCPQAAKIISPRHDNDLNVLLARGLILNDHDKNVLADIVENGLPLLQSLDAHGRIFDNPSRARQKMWWWGEGSSEMIWQERFFGMQPSAGLDLPTEALKLSPHKKPPSALIHLKGWEKVSAGSGIMVTDPRTGARVHAMVLDFKEGKGLASHEVTLWIATWEKPLTTSVLALVHKKILDAVWLAPWAQPSWFDTPSFPAQAMVLVGPAWQVAAWGERHAPSGALTQVVDADTGQTSWGWRMPQKIKACDIVLHRRELLNARHALSFFSAYPHENVDVVFGDVPDAFLRPQSDGVMLDIPMSTWQDKIPFPLRRHLPRPQRTPQGFIVLIPWSLVSRTLSSLEASGASFNVAHHYASYLKKHWPKK